MEGIQEEVVVLFHAALLGRTDVIQVRISLTAISALMKTKIYILDSNRMHWHPYVIVPNLVLKKSLESFLKAEKKIKPHLCISPLTSGIKMSSAHYW